MCRCDQSTTATSARNFERDTTWVGVSSQQQHGSGSLAIYFRRVSCRFSKSFGLQMDSLLAFFSHVRSERKSKATSSSSLEVSDEAETCLSEFEKWLEKCCAEGRQSVSLREWLTEACRQEGDTESPSDAPLPQKKRVARFSDIVVTIPPNQQQRDPKTKFSL